MPKILQIQNEHLDITRKDYSHLANIWFLSNGRKTRDIYFDGYKLFVVILGTSLGWVTSGPIKSSSTLDGIQEVCVNFDAN